MDHSNCSRSRSSSRKRHVEEGDEREGRRSKSRSQTPPKDVGGAVATQEGLPSYEKALSGGVEGQTAGGVSVQCFPSGDGSSNPKGTPIREHCKTAHPGVKSRWGTLLMPSRPKTNGGVVATAEDDDLCAHGLLWHACPLAVTWKVAVLGLLEPADRYLHGEVPSRTGYGFCSYHMNA